jgi:hypothetical protein
MPAKTAAAPGTHRGRETIGSRAPRRSSAAVYRDAVAESSADKRVRRALARSAEFRKLPAERQTHVVDHMLRAGDDAARAMAERGLLDAVDFPQFVADLVEGTFDAIVDASVRQMEAYTQLLRNVAKSADEFLRDNVVDGGKDKSARRRLAAQRQQLLGTMVLMGISRIVVTDGRITAKVVFELEERR